MQVGYEGALPSGETRRINSCHLESRVPSLARPGQAYTEVKKADQVRMRAAPFRRKSACMGGSYGRQQEEQEGKAKERSWNQEDQARSAESGYGLTSKSAGGSEVANGGCSSARGGHGLGTGRNESHRGDPGERRYRGPRQVNASKSGQASRQGRAGGAPEAEAAGSGPSRVHTPGLHMSPN